MPEDKKPASNVHPIATWPHHPVRPVPVTFRYERDTYSELVTMMPRSLFFDEVSGVHLIVGNDLKGFPVSYQMSKISGWST